MRVAVVLSEFPLPTDSGDPLRALQFCEAVLASGFPVDFYVVDRRTTTAADRNAFAKLVPGSGILTFSSRWAQRTSRPWAVVRWLTALAVGRPAWIEQRYSPALAAALQKSAQTYSRLYAVNEASGPYVMDVPARWHWDKSNVLTASRRQSVAAARGVTPKIRTRVDLLMSRTFERRVARRVTSVSVTSAEEASRWAEAVGLRATSVLPSTVPERPALEVRSVPRRIAWLGTFKYKPNWDGLVQFLDAAGPSFIASGSRLALIGSGGNGDVQRRLASYDFVDFVGFAEDLEEALRGCSLGVVPIWQGAGIKMKTLTLMSYGIPLVSTKVGAEGVPHDAFLAIADDAGDLAAAASAQYSEAELIAAGARAREICVARFTSPVFEKAVIELVSSAGADG